MARYVTFNGITRYLPGGITKVNAEALNQVTASDNSIVALVGEADGGAPGSADGVQVIASPSDITEAFRSGPLADACRLAFQSSNDPDVPSGASKVLCYKTNASTQASLSFPLGNAGLSSELTQTLAAPAEADTGGSTTTLIDGTLSAVEDDTYNGMWVVIRPFTTTVEVSHITDWSKSLTKFTFAPAVTALPANTEDYLVLEDQIVSAFSVVVGSSTVAAIATGATMTLNEHADRWLYIQFSETVYYVRRIVSNTTGGVLTLDSPLPAALVAADGAWCEIMANAIDLTSTDYGLHANGLAVDILDSGSGFASDVSFEGVSQTSAAMGGSEFLKVHYNGAVVAAGSTTAHATTVSTTTVIATTSPLDGSATVGRKITIGSEDTIVVSSTSSAVTVSPALSVVPEAGVTVIKVYALTCPMEVVGASGKATSVVITPSNAATAPVSFSITEGMTIRSLVNAISARAEFEAAAGFGVNADTALAEDLDFGPASKVSALASLHLDGEGLKQDLVTLVNYFNTKCPRLSAIRSVDHASSGAGRPASWSGGTLANNPLEAAVNLVGGARGISSNASFQSGFDALLLQRANSVVPLIDQDLSAEGYSSTATFASVAAQAAAHVALCRGSVASERGAYVGMRGTRAAVLAQAQSLNDMDVHLVAQSPTVLDAAGSLKELGPRILAVMAASMRAGVGEVGEPLTHKYLRVSALSQDASWEPSDVGDANALIAGGVLFAESVTGKGTRWVRDLTSHVQDDNLAFSEGSVRDAVRFVAYGLRSVLVDRYIGKKSAPATVASIKDTASTYLELLRADDVIVDSTDPATGTVIRAYHNLKVVSSGDIVTLSVGIFPVPGINFILNDIFLQLPTQVA